MIRTIHCSNGVVVTGRFKGPDEGSFDQFKDLFNQTVSQAARQCSDRILKQIGKAERERICSRLSLLEGKQRSFETKVKVASALILATGLGLGTYYHWDQISNMQIWGQLSKIASDVKTFLF
ncbi:MAG: hypothetical protein FJZ64_01260 [Chlamydiae bacterium]|nr:hypothetical protein [Chlamydiota bacterium]